MIRNSHILRFTTAISTALACGAIPGFAQSAFAQSASGQSAPAQATSGAGEMAPGDIVVTARKREESLLKTPVTVTAMTSETLEAKGIVSMQSLASSTPGININNSSSGHADRSFQQI
jgi:iron complex outermembrane receptor protein